MEIKLIREQFKKHFNDYDVNDQAIIMKYYHSLRVMDLAMLIAKKNDFNDNDAEIASIVGLLHDYARFEQWTQYHTYSDINSIDHGDLAVKRLFDDNDIKLYSLNKGNYDEIYDAIKYHNKIFIPNSLSKHNELLCKVIRDADKLDIFYLLGINKNLFLEDNEDISKELEKEFFMGKQLSRKLTKNKSDNILLDLSMIFDINFKSSFEYIDDNNLIWKMYDNINDKNKFKKYFEYVDKYINERID